VLCLWAQRLQKALKEVGVPYSSVSMIWTVVEVEVEVVLPLSVSKYCLLDGMGVEVDAEAEVNCPSWKPQNVKLHVGFLDSVIALCSNC
jgi:hypothetical protein